MKSAIFWLLVNALGAYYMHSIQANIAYAVLLIGVGFYLCELCNLLDIRKAIILTVTISSEEADKEVLSDIGKK